MVQIETLGEGEGEQQRTPRMPQGSASTLPDFAQAAAAVGEAASETYGLIKAGSDKLILVDLERQYTEEQTNAMKFANNLALEAEKLPAKNAVEYFDHHMKEYDEELASRGFAPMVRDKLKEFVSEYTVDKGMAVQASAFRRAETEQEEAWKVQSIEMMDDYIETGNTIQFFKNLGELSTAIGNSSLYATPDKKFLAQRKVIASLVGEFVGRELDVMKGLTGQELINKGKSLRGLIESGKIDPSLVDIGKIKQQIRGEISRGIEESASMLGGNIALALASAPRTQNLTELAAGWENLYNLRMQNGTGTRTNAEKDAIKLAKGYFGNLQLPDNVTQKELDAIAKEVEDYFFEKGVSVDGKKYINEEYEKRKKGFVAAAEDLSADFSRMLDDNAFNPAAAIAQINELLGRTDIVSDRMSDANILDKILGEPLENHLAHLGVSSGAREKTERILQVYKTFNVISDEQGKAKKALDAALESGDTEAELIVKDELATIGTKGSIKPHISVSPSLQQERKDQINALGSLAEQMAAIEAYAIAGQSTGLEKKYYGIWLNNGEPHNIFNSVRTIHRAGGNISKLDLGGSDTPLGFLAQLAMTAAPDELTLFSLHKKLSTKGGIQSVADAFSFVSDMMSGTLDTVRSSAFSGIVGDLRETLREGLLEGSGDKKIFRSADINQIGPRLAFHLAAALEGKVDVNNLKNQDPTVMKGNLNEALSTALESMKIHNDVVSVPVGDFGRVNLDTVSGKVSDLEMSALDNFFKQTVSADEYVSRVYSPQSTGRGVYAGANTDDDTKIYIHLHLLNATMMDVRNVYQNAVMDLQNYIVSDEVQEGKRTLIIPLAKEQSGGVFGYMAFNIDVNPNTGVLGGLSPIQIPDQNGILRESNGVVSIDMEWKRFEDIAEQKLDHTHLQGEIETITKINQSFNNYGINKYATGSGQKISLAAAVDLLGADAAMRLGINASIDEIILEILDDAERLGYTVLSDPVNTGTTP